MKRMNFPGMCILSLCMLLLVACDNDNKQSPIKLTTKEDTRLNLWYSAGQETYTYELEGGDGLYKAVSRAPEVVDARIVAGELHLRMKGRGHAVVLVMDKSGNSLSLDVYVDYFTYQMIVARQDVMIGGNPDEDTRNKISQKALSALPVRVGGGYKFVFMDEKQQTGKVYIYPEKFGEEYTETDFAVRVLQRGEEGTKYGNYFFDLTLDGKERTFVWATSNLNGTRTSEVRSIILLEDLTEDLKADYPDMDAICTLQVMELPR